MKRNKKQMVRVGGMLTLLISMCFSVMAQTGTIKGKIIDARTKEALLGVTVMLQGISGKGAITDFDGNYVIETVPAGTYTLNVSLFSYQEIAKNNITVEAGKETMVNFSLEADRNLIDVVQVVARVNRESEISLITEQRAALVSTQSIGARELSRKGVGNAQAAVTQVSGISKQEGVKNVFVRGLGDRYNMTLLNSFPIPSEDPEYKNVALEFFSTDVIQSIGVNKVFAASDYSDVGGAIINISSKELVGDYALSVDVSAGVNTALIGTLSGEKGEGSGFLRQDGSNYFGFANGEQPATNKFTFPNSLDPSKVAFPVNHGFGISGGKLFKIGEKQNPLSFFATASHSIDYSFTEEIVRNATTNGTIFQDQTGNTHSQNTAQLALADALYEINQKHQLNYNFMLIHANNQYFSEYIGRNHNFEDAYDAETGVLRRQQANDNLLLVNQLSSNWRLTDKLKFDAGAAYNVVQGNEPDRRENSFSLQQEGNYIFSGGDKQSRFFSKLKTNDFNAKAGFTYTLNDRFESNNSLLKIGYSGRFNNTNFVAQRYSFQNAPPSLQDKFYLNDLQLDDWYNAQNQVERRADRIGRKFTMTTGTPDLYDIAQNIHSAYAEGSYQLWQNVTANVGVRMDVIDMQIDYNLQRRPGSEEITQNFLLPSLNLKYNVTAKNTLRFGASKTYTLPQSKELSPYEYVDISFTSKGNPNLKTSENYNVDLKWDYYLSASELLTVTGFYKYILNPIGRINAGNAAGTLTYENISNNATVAGIELEVRKNLMNKFDTELEKSQKLTAGVNASYIYSSLQLEVNNIEPRNSELEGASPLLANADISYNYTVKDKSLTAAIVVNYFSNRIHTIGAYGFKDIIEKGLPTMDFAASYKFNKHFSVKVKASNILDIAYKLTTEVTTGADAGQEIVLTEYKKGRNITVGLSYEF